MSERIIEIKCFNQLQSDRYHQWLGDLKKEKRITSELLKTRNKLIKEAKLFSNSTYSITDDLDLKVKYNMARWLYSVVELNRLEHDQFIGTWEYLSLVFAEEMLKDQGKNPVGAIERWSPSLQWNKYYRHLLAGPWRFYFSIYSRMNLDNEEEANRILKAILQGPVSTHGDLFEAIASRFEIVSNPSIIACIMELGWVENKESFYPGFIVKIKGSGRLRRLIDLFSQLELTYDLDALSKEQILDLLPTRDKEVFYDRKKTAK
jgi:hypothetical protein